MGKEEIFAELDKLLNVPQFERIVIHKLRELEGFLKDEISLYLSIRQRLRNEAYGHMQVCEDDHQGENQTLRIYYFQVDKRDKEGWIPGGIEPFLPSDSGIYDIVPPVIIEYMTRVDVNPTKIESRSAFQHPQLGSRKFNFRFAKFSPYHILGTIAEIKVENKETQPGTAERKSGLENVVAINDYIERKAQNADYDELKYYMKKYPEFEEHIFSEFYMRWKPLIDRKLLDLSMLP